MPRNCATELNRLACATRGPKLVAFQNLGARVCQVTCQPQVDQVGRTHTQI